MTLRQHLTLEHKISPFSTYLREIVYGGNDGIVTTFAVVAGFAGAQAETFMSTAYLPVLLFGLANLFADATSMSLGSFLSLRAEQDMYKTQKAKEVHEIRHNPEMERLETIEILQKKGYSKTDAHEMTKLYQKNEKYWAEFMMNDELEIPNPERINAHYTAIATFLSFAAFGFIPLVPYIFFKSTPQTFGVSVLFTFLALLLLGVLRWQVTSRHIIRSITESLVVGGASASVAYFVGILFRA